MSRCNVSYFYRDEWKKKYEGRKIEKVELSADKEFFSIEFEGGETVRFGVEGDCCSHSWIEHLETPNDLKGATLLDVAEDSMDATDDDAYNPPRAAASTYHPREHECLQVYSTRFITDRGEVVLEYRNSSNGYYGGSLYLVVPGQRW